MSEPEPIDQQAASRRGGKSIAFRKSSKAPVPTPDQPRRHSDLVQAAWRHFREAAPMIAFLNPRYGGLDRQPLHLAIESDEGLARVERLLRQPNA